MVTYLYNSLVDTSELIVNKILMVEIFPKKGKTNCCFLTCLKVRILDIYDL